MKNEKAMVELSRAEEMSNSLDSIIIKSITRALIYDCDYDELGIIISALTHALEAKLIEDGENPDVDDADVIYESEFGLHRIQTVTLTKGYRDWAQQVLSFIRLECNKKPINPRAKRTHIINLLIVDGLTLYRDVIKLPDSPAKSQILNKTRTFLPILMMYLFENKLSFKISNFIKDVSV